MRNVHLRAGYTTAFALILACGSGLGNSEAVGTTRQAITPTYYDVPDLLGNTTVLGPPKKSPPGATPNIPPNPEFCFVSRITGPFYNFDDLGEHQDDNWFEIGDNGNTFSFRVNSAAPNLLHLKVGCVPFSALLHAGNATSEGETGPFDLEETGATFGNHDLVPATGSRTPSFCTLSRVWGNFGRQYSNCSGVTHAESVNDDHLPRTSDVADNGVNGQSCPQAGTIPGLPGYHPAHYGTISMSSMCNTKWSGMAGAQLIQFGPVDQRSKTGDGNPLMKKSEGVCWISGIDGTVTVPGGGTTAQPPFASAAEYAQIGEVTDGGGEAWWSIQSSSDDIASASCIKLDQAQ
jgi:hypothetical protein